MTKRKCKCYTCDVFRRCAESVEPAVCKWYMENVVCGDKKTDDCPEYEPRKGE